MSPSSWPRWRCRAQPRARCCSRSGDALLSDLLYYGFLNTTIADCPVMISRTGYTGDLGYELWLAAEPAVAGRVWDALVAAGRSYGLQPAGIWALDVARIEAGLIMLDVDSRPRTRALADIQTSTPLELGLGCAISWKKPGLVGARRCSKKSSAGRPARWWGWRSTTPSLCASTTRSA